MRHATPSQLQGFAEAILRAAGADEASAEAASFAMLHASLHGIDSHGIRLLPWYADCLRKGLVNGTPAIRVSYPRRAAAVVDAGGGLGHLATYRAMDEACTLARDCGVGLCLVTHSSHFGAAGAYAFAAAQAGFIGLVTANSGAFVIPHGGTAPIHGTNPIALAAPNPGGEPFLLDMATSAIPWNKVLKFRSEGFELPEEVAVDPHGRFTRDAHRAAALAPLGGKHFGYKGAGLAGFAEILGGVLTGMRLSTEQDLAAGADAELGHFVLAVDPTVLIPLEAFGFRLTSYLEGFKPQPGTYAAGGPEWERRERRLRDGIPISDGLYAELAEAAGIASVSIPF
jgi:LDH2 family malate/lactate/ureidoglycolate dehydrogenase